MSIADEKIRGGIPSLAKPERALGEILLAEAARLARRGRWVEAEAALGLPLTNGEPMRGEALDLLARIHAQQGRWAESRAAWTEALRLDPKNEGYLAGLRRLSHPAALLNRDWLVLWIIAAALGLIVALGFWIY